MPVPDFVVLELDNQTEAECSLARGQVIPADRLVCGARYFVAVSTKPNAGEKHSHTTECQRVPVHQRDNTNRAPTFLFFHITIDEVSRQPLELSLVATRPSLLFELSHPILLRSFTRYTSTRRRCI